MKRQVLILRHGKAFDDHPEGDWHRALKKKGYRDAAIVAQYLLDNDLVPDYVLTSTGIRAAETAQAVIDGLDGIHPPKRSLDSLYHAASGYIRSVVSGFDNKTRRLLVVGHNPGLSMLVDDLMTADTELRERYTGLPKSGLAVFEFNGIWVDIESAECHLTHYIHPKQEEWGS